MSFPPVDSLTDMSGRGHPGLSALQDSALLEISASSSDPVDIAQLVTQALLKSHPLAICPPPSPGTLSATALTPLFISFELSLKSPALPDPPMTSTIVTSLRDFIFVSTVCLLETAIGCPS
jgi:hypothetical protein